jgi:hypothetical protein
VDKVLQCNCGFQARAPHEEGLVAEVRRHASEAHGMTLTHEEALLLVFRAELDEQAMYAMSRETEARNDKEEK